MPTVRFRSPSELRFLLNERAALAGSVARINQDLPSLESLALKLEVRALKTRNEITVAQRSLGAFQAEIAALDLVLEQGYPEVEPSCGGTVLPWAGKYGRRGELKAFIHAAVRDAYQFGLPTGALMKAIISRFALSTNREEFIRLRHVVTKQLSLAKAAGLMRSRSGRKPGSSVWFWVPETCGAELVDYQLARGSEHEKPNAIGLEVGG